MCSKLTTGMFRRAVPINRFPVQARKGELIYDRIEVALRADILMELLPAGRYVCLTEDWEPVEPLQTFILADKESLESGAIKGFGE